MWSWNEIEDVRSFDGDKVGWREPLTKREVSLCHLRRENIIRLILYLSVSFVLFPSQISKRLALIIILVRSHTNDGIFILE